MQEYISRKHFEDMVDYYLSNSNGAEHYAYGVIRGELRCTPAADVVEVKRGYWKDTSYIGVSRCSCCDKPSSTPDCLKVFYKFCPNCGAKMDGENK